MVKSSGWTHGTAPLRHPRRWVHVLTLFLLIIGFDCSFITPVWAERLLPETPPPGARAYAMGGAYVAVVDDPSALYWNPAALGRGRLQLHLSAGGEGLDQAADLLALDRALEEADTDELNRLASETIQIPLTGLAAVGVGPGAVGLGAQGLARASVQETGATAEFIRVTPFRAGAGLPVLSIPALGELRVGASAAYYAAEHYHWTAADDEPARRSGTGFGIDVGARMGLTPWLAAGLVVHDVVNTFAWEAAEPASPEPSWQLGVEASLLGLTLAADLDSERLLHAGGEWSLLGVLSLRGGYVHPLDPDAAPEDLARVRVGLGAGFLVGGLDLALGLKLDPIAVKDLMIGASFGF